MCYKIILKLKLVSRFVGYSGWDGKCLMLNIQVSVVCEYYHSFKPL